MYLKIKSFQIDNDYSLRIVKILLLVIALVYLSNKIVIFALIFGILELIREYLRVSGIFNLLFIPFIDIGIIFASYYDYPQISVFILLFFMFFSKGIFGKFRFKYITKALVWLGFFYFFIPIFRGFEISVIGPLILLFRYMFDYLIQIITKNLTFKDLITRILCLLSAVVIFGVI
ncbi:hypothetical protein HON01_11730 [Candidatus Woesearchaeota archaeon]|jgi:hypothetical protein|nr:hypothetical protein [archaeon]MBT5023482.1 hypothetical protein [Candidatus Woesearchaeota archaeon]MBT4022593.1 hypothetical protein [archaeon]MBT4272033.1 hypothetical protein [archaeon]MBT4461130.1 hypothetical protein [archaeon]